MGSSNAVVREPRSRDLAPLIDLAVIVGMWLTAIALTHPIGEFPLDDDWVYALSVKSILSTGVFALPSPASANFIAQAYWGSLFCLPFGFSFTALRMSTISLGAAGLIAVYLLARELGGSRRTGLMSALAIGLNPLYVAMSVTFMSDVPFVAVSTAALLCFVRGLQRDSHRWIIAAFALALAAVMIRQFAFIFIGGFCCAYWFHNRSSRKAVVVLVLVPLVGMAMHLAFQRWLVLSGRTPMVPIGSIGDLQAESFSDGLLNLFNAAKVVPYVGLIAAPILALSLRRFALTRETLVRLATLGFLIIAELFVMQFQFPTVHNGNVLATWGVGPLALRDTAYFRTNFPVVSVPLTVFWAAVTASSLVAGAMMLERLIQATGQVAAVALKPSQWPGQWLSALAIALSGLLGLLLAMLSIRFSLYDRYIMVMMPISLVIIAAVGQPIAPVAPSRIGLAVGIGLVLAYGAFSVAGTRDFLEWNRQRWAATAALEARQVSPRRIDGGYEYNGLRLNDVGYRPVTGKSAWWVTDDEFIIASGPLPGYRMAQRFPFRRWLTGERAAVLILQRETPGGR